MLQRLAKIPSMYIGKNVLILDFDEQFMFKQGQVLFYSISILDIIVVRVGHLTQLLCISRKALAFSTIFSAIGNDQSTILFIHKQRLYMTPSSKLDFSITSSSFSRRSRFFACNEKHGNDDDGDSNKTNI